MSKKTHTWRLENLIYVRNNLTEYDQVCIVCSTIVHVSPPEPESECPGKPDDMV